MQSVGYKRGMTPKIAVVCALKEELAAVKAGLGGEAARFELIQAGVGPKSAARVAEELAAREQPPEVVVSTGFCGGLVDELNVGDIVVAHEVRAGEPPAPQNSDRAKALIEIVSAALGKTKLRWKCGAMVCAENAVFKSKDKRVLGEKTGALAVDMESFALAANLDSARTALIAIRAVSDSVDDELPPEVAEFLDESGNVRAGKVTRFIFKRPKNFTRLLALKKRADSAAASLTEAWRALAKLDFETVKP